MWEKLKQRWNVNNSLDVVIILVVFACTGTSVLYIKRLLFEWMGIHTETPAWIRWSASLLIILPLYQVILLAWGWLFGKFDFFWNFEKRMLDRMRAVFRRN